MPMPLATGYDVAAAIAFTLFPRKDQPPPDLAFLEQDFMLRALKCRDDGNVGLGRFWLDGIYLIRDMRAVA